MARVLTPEQFRKCPKGTVFAVGGVWHFSNLLVLDAVIEPYGDGGWGFYAVDPMWVESEDCGEAFSRLDEMRDSGARYPAETCSTKYMSYDGDPMDFFFVLDRSDWQALCEVVEPAFQSGEA
jgi:hypothetical protein